MTFLFSSSSPSCSSCSSFLACFFCHYCCLLCGVSGASPLWSWSKFSLFVWSQSPWFKTITASAFTFIPPIHTHEFIYLSINIYTAGPLDCQHTTDTIVSLMYNTNSRLMKWKEWCFLSSVTSSILVNKICGRIQMFTGASYHTLMLSCTLTLAFISTWSQYLDNNYQC